MSGFLQCLWLLAALFTFLGNIPFARAEFSEERPIHHFFNARLLAPKEYQISVVGNVKYGVNDELEIGTQGLLFLFGGLNLAIKHKMFEQDDWTTSFVFHGVRMQTQEQAFLAGSDDTDSSGQPIAYSVLRYITAAGIVTTYDLSPTAFLNFGLYDFWLRESVPAMDNSVGSVQSISLAVGFDHYLSRETAISVSYCHALWLLGEVTSDSSDLELSVNTLTGLPPSLNPSVGFATMTQSWDMLNIEGGLIFIALQPMVYGNVFWRFF